MVLHKRRQRALATDVERHGGAGEEGVGLLQRAQEHGSQEVEGGHAVADGLQEARRLAAPHYLLTEGRHGHELRPRGCRNHADQRHVQSPPEEVRCRMHTLATRKLLGGRQVQRPNNGLLQNRAQAAFKPYQTHVCIDSTTHRYLWAARSVRRREQRRRGSRPRCTC